MLYDWTEAEICIDLERSIAAAEMDHAQWGAHRHRKAMILQKAATVRFHEAKRRAAQLKRTPPWANMTAIKAMYAEAQRLTAETGVPHHVDHTIPLQGKKVSGLHVENNLQILTGSDNSKKGNRYDPEHMPQGFDENAKDEQ